MRSAKFFLLLWLCFTVTNAWADVLPSPGHFPNPFRRHRQHQPNRSPDNPAEARAVGFSMAAAEVNVRIEKTRVDGADGVGISPMSASVKADFDMTGAPTITTGNWIEVLFPVDIKKDGVTATGAFAATVDGKPAEDLKKRFWTATDEHGDQVSLWGYAWRLPCVKVGQKRRISVQYSIVLPQDGGKPHFTYFLRSGAQWDGPIGHETVRVETDKGLGVKVLSPVVLKPAARATNSLTWQIIDAKPDEDIKLEISPEVEP